MPQERRMPTGFMRNNARILAWWAASLLMLAALAVFACVRILSAAEDPPVDHLGKIGVFVSVFLVITLTATLVGSLHAHWARIAVRIVGKEIAAIGLLMIFLPRPRSGLKRFVNAGNRRPGFGRGQGGGMMEKGRTMEGLPGIGVRLDEARGVKK